MLETQTVVLSLRDGSAVVLDVVMRERSKSGDIVWQRSGSIEDAIAETKLDAVSWMNVERSQLPEASFQSAWVVDGSRVVVDMAKARDIHRAKIRRARAPLLAELDVAYQRSDEVGNDDIKSDIAARKAALRDCTEDSLIEAATTPEQLKKVWPDALTLAAAPFSIEPGDGAKKDGRVEVDLTPILAALTALNERLELTDKKADEASKQASKSLKYIDAINEGMGNVAEGRV